MNEKNEKEREGTMQYGRNDIWERMKKTKKKWNWLKIQRNHVLISEKIWRKNENKGEKKKIAEKRRKRNKEFRERCIKKIGK